MIHTEAALKLSCQRALIGAIPRNLRGLTVALENETLYWKCYFDGEPNEDEKEVLSSACAEVIADFPVIMVCEEEYLKQPYPLKMEMLQFWAFLRWENDEPI